MSYRFSGGGDKLVMPFWLKLKAKIINNAKKTGEGHDSPLQSWFLAKLAYSNLLENQVFFITTSVELTLLLLTSIEE